MDPRQQLKRGVPCFEVGAETRTADQQEAIFAEHALDYLPAFFAVPTSSAPEGLQLALICTEYCSAREAILALGEACSGIEESFFGCVVSDDEDVDDNEMEGDLRDEVDDTDEVQRLVPVQMKVLFQALSACRLSSPARVLRIH